MVEEVFVLCGHGWRTVIAYKLSLRKFTSSYRLFFGLLLTVISQNSLEFRNGNTWLPHNWVFWQFLTWMYFNWAPFNTAEALCQFASEKFGELVREGDLIRGSGQHPPSGHIILSPDRLRSILKEHPVIVWFFFFLTDIFFRNTRMALFFYHYIIGSTYSFVLHPQDLPSTSTMGSLFMTKKYIV